MQLGEQYNYSKKVRNEKNSKLFETWCCESYNPFAVFNFLFVEWLFAKFRETIFFVGIILLHFWNEVRPRVDVSKEVKKSGLFRMNSKFSSYRSAFLLNGLRLIFSNSQGSLNERFSSLLARKGRNVDCSNFYLQEKWESRLSTF